MSLGRPVPTASSSAPRVCCAAPGFGAAATRSPPSAACWRPKPIEMTGAPADLSESRPALSRLRIQVTVSEPCSKASTPNPCWRSTSAAAPTKPSRSRDWVRRHGASAEEPHHRIGERQFAARLPEDFSRRDFIADCSSKCVALIRNSNLLRIAITELESIYVDFLSRWQLNDPLLCTDDGAASCSHRLGSSG